MTCTQISHVVYPAIMSGVLALEYWLGKTEKVQAGSIVEVGFLAVAAVVAYIFKQKENHDDSKKS